MSSLHKRHAEKDLTQVRLKEDEVVEDAWIEMILQRGTHAVLGTIYEGQPFVTPILYYFAKDKKAIYFHGAKAGRLRANLHFNPKVSLNVNEFGEIFSHAEAAEFNVEYNSVTAFGSGYLVEDETEKHTILQALLDKYAPHMQPEKDYQPIQDEELIKTQVYRIDITAWSGKRQAYDPEYYSGAFPYVQKKDKPNE